MVVFALKFLEYYLYGKLKNMSYFDLTRFDYDDLDPKTSQELVVRDKNAYKEAFQKWISEKINEITDRKWHIDNIGFIEKSGDFIKLIKEAELSYTLGAYYSAIALVGVAAEDLTKFFAISFNKIELNKETQDNRLKKLKDMDLIHEEIYENLNEIRKMRNEILHFNQDFKLKKDNDLQKLSLDLINRLKITYRNILQNDDAEISIDTIDKIIKSYAEQSVNKDYHYGNTLNQSEFTMKLRYIMVKALQIDIAFAEPDSLQEREGLYRIMEVDLEIDPQEITLLDINNDLLFYIDLTPDIIQKISSEDLSEGDIIHANIYSKATKLGNTESWYIKNFYKN